MPETPNIVIESQNTSFSRIGSTYQTIERATPSIAALNTNKLNYITDPTSIPGGAKLATIMALSDAGYPHYSELSNLLSNVIANMPLFEERTSDLYARSFSIARAAAQSGPVNVRGGTAQMAFELAELDTLQSISRFKEVWTAWMQAWALETQIIKMANDIPTEIHKEWMQAQVQQSDSENKQRMANIALAEVYNAYNKTLVEQYSAMSNFGKSTMKTEESFSGQGSGQSGITTGFGMSSYR